MYGGNIYRTSTYGEAFPYQTGVDPVAAALTFALPQNEPNPFRAGTTIRYSLPQEAKVLLRIPAMDLKKGTATTVVLTGASKLAYFTFTDAMITTLKTRPR